MQLDSSLLILILIGAASGLISGFFGVGGGIIIIPALVYMAGFSQKTATGTSLAILLPPVSFAAVYEYYRHGYVNIKAAVIVAIGLFIFSWISSRIALRLHPTVLRLAFGFFVILMGVYIVVSTFQRMRPPDS